MTDSGESGGTGNRASGETTENGETGGAIENGETGGTRTPEMTFDHAGIATDDIEGLTDLYVDLCGCSIAHRETFDGMAVLFLDVGNGYLELLEPQDDSGAITRYLDNNGPGIHHLALATDDIDAALANARELGVNCIDEQPREGAWGHDVAFLHPKSTGGILVEFVEH
jgi:methylmalonyl-CoA/ethylmalonyl-CoA epimerase